MSKTRSIKGEIVDFDLLKIKQNMERKDKPEDVAMRERHIDIKRRRNPRRNVSDLIVEQERNRDDIANRLKVAKANKKIEAEAAEKAEKEDDKASTKRSPSPSPSPSASASASDEKGKDEQEEFFDTEEHSYDESVQKPRTKIVKRRGSKSADDNTDED